MNRTELAHVYREVIKCNRCGLCQPTCPIYRVTGKESLVARGHHAHLREILEGRFDLTPDLKGPFFECLTCKACTANCPPAVDITPVMIQARAAYYKRYPRPIIQRLIFKSVLPHPKRLAWGAKVLALSKRLGLSRLAKATGLLGLLHKDLPRAESLLDNLPLRSFSDRLSSIRIKHDQAEQRVAYFNSCGFNYMFPEVSEATVRVLTRLGYGVDILPNVCCGLPPYSYGDLENAKALARRNIDVFQKTPAGIILSDCGSCSSHLKEYVHLLADDPAYATAAAAFSAKVRDINEFLAEIVPSYNGLQPIAAIVTYHDPCHLSRYQRITAQPRALLQRIPGLQYRELPEADWCCGAAGTYNVAHYDQSMAVLQRKMGNVAKTGATLLATSCPACMLQLSHGVGMKGLQVQVKHVVQILAEAMGI